MGGEGGQLHAGTYRRTVDGHRETIGQTIQPRRSVSRRSHQMAGDRVIDGTELGRVSASAEGRAVPDQVDGALVARDGQSPERVH